VKVRVPLMVQDPTTARIKEMPPVEGFDIDQEDFFLDGPVARRVAVLDFDPVTGVLVPGVRFLPPAPDRVLGKYDVADEDDIHARDFNQVSVFASVIKTMYMFEENDTLGRALSWAFDGPQLLVVPRAGEWANAYYERESRSLQFFYFPSARDPGEVIYTSLSLDIVAHEAAHAILDGIAPDLYNAISPQSLALHEAIADLTALIMAFRSRTLVKTTLAVTGGSIRDSTAFSSVAEEFGYARDPDGPAVELRQLLNNKTLDPDAIGPNRVSRDDPHALSEVLSGALYSVMVKMHDTVKRELAERDGRTEFEVSGRALWISARRFKRMIFRALDYLPPGEISFVDYGRAIIASDQASHPGDSEEREWICQEFVRRHMVPNVAALKVETNLQAPELDDVDLTTLVQSDWAAYEFANRHREFLGIPEGIHFRVRPRLDVAKVYFHRDRREEKVRECIFKVSWDRKETNQFGPFFPAERQITVGTTLAIDWNTRLVRARLTSDLGMQSRLDRDQMLLRLIDENKLMVGNQAVGPDGRWLRSAIRAESMDGLMRIRATARMLHVTP
jgi:hypothetical protein